MYDSIGPNALARSEAQTETKDVNREQPTQTHHAKKWCHALAYVVTVDVVTPSVICHGRCRKYQRSQDLIQSRMGMCQTTVATVLSGQCDGVMA